MAQYRLHRWTELAKRLVQLNDLKQRVVPEAVRPRWLEADSAAANRFAIGSDMPARVGQSQMANIMTRTFVHGSVC